ncbi:condensin subunit BRN1 [Aspergillus mulundensis]|uniref:Condensin complex subunit 2 n=1 Tax=Aspergillus mulundensis TaxID=1810919 RepID=A0A3D8T3W8_9EURO|nr:Condensin complex subunit 2 [Aspergillus mulundensis]RDW93246.1 Condensin complex subunit 2 [Aspergillus mulundensis]
MPRVSKHRRSNGAGTPQKNSPLKIPLNDDIGEKAARMGARQALHDRQMDQIKAAVKTPMPPRRYTTYDRGSLSPSTPQGSSHRHRDSDVHGRRGVTPMKRVPILANFEEWMKMATDNKINATNSWNFALIDYFHDMSLLKEGDSVNFQKASCTLDGCVKIYTSRVDSVATETGKLLSGLADSRDKKARETEADGDEAEDEEEDGEEGTSRRSRRKRAHEATLAPSFASLQLKKFELEFSVDPLFKKASADFDEGGAKGLLLNHLSIDGHGRIVFDSSDDAVETSQDTDGGRAESEAPEQADTTPQPTPAEQDRDDTFEGGVEIDIAPLTSRFFPDLDRLDAQDICPSLKNFDLGDPSGSLDIPLLKAPEDWRQEKGHEDGHPSNDASGIMLDDDNAVGFDDDDGSLAGFDLSDDAGFGGGGEAWAREAALEPMLKVHRVDMEGEEAPDGAGLENDDAYTISLNHKPSTRDHENILSYFDNALQKNWAGPEHWKIRRIKENAATNTASAAPKQRKEKEPFEIDFSAPLDPAVAELIYTPASSNSTISLPKTQWKTKSRNLLPDDKHFNSRQLLRLFLKPKARMGSRKLIGLRNFNQRRQEQTSGNGEMDEAFWANHKTEDHAGDDGAAPGAYDANFFADDDGLAFPNGIDLDDDDNLPFADAREMLSPPPGGVPGASTGDAGGATGLTALLNMVGATPGGSQLQTGAGGFGSQLVTQGGRRARPDYVAYARVAKKVDVRRLKTEMWKGMGERLISAMDSDRQPSAVASPPKEHHETDEDGPPTPTPMHKRPRLSSDLESDKDGHLRFTEIMNSLKSVYAPETLRDISTSYGFICLLHLANEQGLLLQNDDDASGLGLGKLEEIFVMKDTNAILDEAAA